MIRAFLGIDLPEEVRAALTLQQFLLPLPRRLEPAAFHLTLVFLGEVAEPVLEAAHDGFSTLRAAPLTLALQGLGIFGGDRPRAVWAGLAPSDPLMALQARAERIARLSGCPVDHRRFVPHVTLGRFPPPPLAEAMRLERAVAAGAGFRAGPWQADRLTLWQSHLSSRSARYEVLADYPLWGG